MKRIFALLLTSCFLLIALIGLTSCDGDSTTNSTSSTDSTAAPNTPQKLSTPVVTLEGNVASWDAFPLADKFEISLDGNLSYVENTVTSKTLSNGQTIKVRAVGDGTDYKTSDWSNAVTYTEAAPPAPNQPTKLEAPVVTISSTGLASWSVVPNAISYIYKIDGGTEIATGTTAVQLTNGQSITVKAVGNITDYTDSDWSDTATYTVTVDPPINQPTKLGTPFVTVSQTGLASWQGIANASGYIYKINNGTETATTSTSVQLSNGQSITVKAVGNGTDYTDSNWSNTATYTQGSVTPPPEQGSEPTYLGILATKTQPSASEGVPSSISPRVARIISPISARMISSQGYRNFSEALLELFANSDNYLGATYPAESNYDVYATAGETVYVQIWLDNPNQYTILSLMLNGTKYQVGGGLSSFFVEKDGQHYNCVYVALSIPSDARTEQEYVVSNIEYIADTYINADGTDQFMNENDTVIVGLPYGTRPNGTSFEELSVSTDGFGFSFDLIDNDNVASNSGNWLGVCVYDGYDIIFNSLATVGSNSKEVTGLAEDSRYEIIVYLFGDLHDGAGVKAHAIASYYVSTKSVVEFFEVEADYYCEADFTEWGGNEADSGLSINVNAFLSSPTARFDRLELYRGDELVYTKEEFYSYDTIKDLLANTTYRVRLYFSDDNYSEHYVEEYVTTGKMSVPEMDLQNKYAFLNSALFTFDYIQNGFLGQAITKNVRVQIYKPGIWQLEYMDWILMLCDDPELYDRTQAAFDEAVANGDWSLASKIDHESLTFLRQAKDIMNEGELGDFGTDRQAWEAYFDTVCKTFYLNTTDDFFGNDNGAALSHLIFRDYFIYFDDEANYKIFADVDMKNGEGFVTKELNSGSFYSFHPINSENNSLEFDCEINGMNVKVNPYFRINREDNKILVISYEIGIYTTSGELVDTLYESEEVNWQDFDEEAWINAYILAMKGEAILPSEEQIIKEFGWRAIFEIMLNIEFDYEDDFTGGGNGEVVAPGGDYIVDGNITVAGKGEKNIANQRERQILRDLLAYDFPEWYEYDLKTTMLDAFTCDQYYWDLISGIDGIDAQLEALISGALNSSIDRVISACESGIQHFLTWFGSEEDEIYLGFKAVIESYLEDTGKTPYVNWADSYRRIMMFEDFYYFYPFGYVKDFEIDIEDGKYPTGEYLIGIKYRYDSYEEDDYEVRFDHYNTIKISGKLPTPTFEISNDGYLTNATADVTNFWSYHIEIEVVSSQGIVMFTGDYYDYGEHRLQAGWRVRARTVFNDGATSDLYNGNSEWSDYQEFAGIRIDTPNVEYSERDDAVKWYADRGEVSHFVYIINDGVAITVPKKSGEYFITLKYGDTIRVKAVPVDQATNDGYIESEWAEYTCQDAREMLQAPTLVLSGEGKETCLKWNVINGASRYLLEITNANGEINTLEEYGTEFNILEAGATYRIRAISENGDIRSSLYSAKVTFAPKLASPELKSATADMVRWQSGDSFTRGFNYKIGVNGEVQSTNRSLLNFKNIGADVGDEIYVQAYAPGCESSDWVLLCTVPASE